MSNDALYSSSEITKTYEQVHDLLLTRYIIKSYSTNKNDIRDVALAGTDLSKVKRVLELGCGYGFFIEKLKGMLHENAVIIGIDMVENNREPFLHSVASIQYKGEFITAKAEIIKEMASESFDLIITSYSLYFFPYLMHEIARILSTDGVYIAITHSENTLYEAIDIIKQCMKSIGLQINDDTVLHKLFYSFSLENGIHQLKKHFSKIEKISYSNSIIFSYKNIKDCIFYIQKKKSLIYKEVIENMPDKIAEMEQCVEGKIIHAQHFRAMPAAAINRPGGDGATPLAAIPF